MAEVPGSEQVYPAQMVLLALGFLGPETAIVKELGLDQDARGNIKADTKSYKTSMDKIYACGDARRGQSLIVWVRILARPLKRFCSNWFSFAKQGIQEGRACAASVDADLTGKQSLPVAGSFKRREFIKPSMKGELVTGVAA